MPLDALRDRAEKAWLEALARPGLSRLTARLSDLHAPASVLQPLLRGYVALYGVDTDAAEGSLEDFSTFDDFFTRRLRPGLRPIASEPHALVSPADARLDAAGAIPDNRRLTQIKGRDYGVDELLGEDGERFAGGVYATLYLSPKDYHRVHVPAAGAITRWRYIPGARYPVNSLAVRQVDRLFCVNERLVVFLDTPDGDVAVVLVGASNVSRISMSAAGFSQAGSVPVGDGAPPSPIPVKRGQELGAFHLGSTVVMLAANPNWLQSGRCAGLDVRLGETLFRR